MSKLIKVILICLLAMIFLSILTLAALFIFVEPNNFKQKLAQQVEASTGRTLQITGDLHWSIFPWLGIKAEKVSLSNAPGFSASPFASIKEIDIRVKLLPLLKQHIEVDKLYLRDADFLLQRNAAGDTNWKGILAVNAPISDQPLVKNKANSVSSASFKLSQVEIDNAKVQWLDARARTSWILDSLHLRSKDISLDKAFPLELSFTLQDDKPTLRVQLQMMAKCQYAPPQQILSLTKLKLKGFVDTAKIQHQPIALSGDATIGLKDKASWIKGMKFNFSNLYLQGELLAEQQKNVPIVRGQLQIPDFNLKQWLKAVGFNLPIMSSATALQHVSGSLQLQANPKQITLPEWRIKFDDSNLSGQLAIEQDTLTRIMLQLDLDKINIADYLSVAPNQAATPLKMTAIRYHGKAIIKRADGSNSLFERMLSDGQLSIHAAQFDKLQVTEIKGHLINRYGVLQLAPLTARIYGGNYHANLSYKMHESIPAWVTTQSLKGANIAELMQALKGFAHIQLSGIGDVDASLTAAGKDLLALKRSLAGKIKFAVQQGKLQGINLEYWLNVGSALYHREALPNSNVPKETDFGNLTGTLLFKQGIAHNDDLLLQARFMRITGKGIIDLPRQHLDYRLDAVKVNPANRQPRQDVIPIHVSGGFDDLSVRPDVKQLIQNAAQKELQKQADRLHTKLQEQGEKYLGKAWGEKLKKIDVKGLFH